MKKCQDEWQAMGIWSKIVEQKVFYLNIDALKRKLTLFFSLSSLFLWSLKCGIFLQATWLNTTAKFTSLMEKAPAFWLCAEEK
jgi:hypothetical protein